MPKKNGEPTAAELRKLEKEREEQPQPEPATGADEVLNGLFIIAQTDENGNLAPRIVLNGETKLTEVYTILAVSLRNFKQEMGFE